MGLRPVPARWFEILIAREDLVKAVETLARTGEVELETHSESTQRATMPDLRDRFEEYNRLHRRYFRYWPQQHLHPSDSPGQPSQRLDRALDRLIAWQHAADSVIEHLETTINEQNELTLLQSLLNNLQAESLDFSLLVNTGPTLTSRLFVLPLAFRIEHLPPSVLSLRTRTKQNLFLLVVGPVNTVNTLQRDLVLQKGRAIILPSWIHGQITEVNRQVNIRFQSNAAQIKKLEETLQSIHHQHSLSEVLGDIRQLEWFIAHVSELPVSENFAWITGWTSYAKDDDLNRELERASVRAVVHFPPKPVDTSPPMILRNPWWSSPFEIFAKLLGVPSQDEVDPSFLLVIIVPLLFGYMFGDVGQGAVLVLTGIMLCKRWPILKLLIGCGIASIIFGFVFGSVFGSEHVIEPLWVNPVENPLPVLLLPLSGGIIILLLGLIFNGIQAYWRGEQKLWLRVEAAVIVLYIGAIGGLINNMMLILIPVGVLWYLLGVVSIDMKVVELSFSKKHIVKSLGQALGQLLESVFQLLINTVSFIRVGAFALAHAGLSLAFVILADTVSSNFVAAIVLIIGNIVILLLEGLVVSIQTTRLVLFEFFIRFLRGTGRMFQPLAKPSNSNRAT